MSEKITFAQLVEDLSDDMIIPKTQSQEFINTLLDVILDDIKAEGKAAITNFGSFKVVQVSERAGVNPKTGEQITIPAHDRLSFTPYKALEKTVNRDFEHLEAKVLNPPKETQEQEPEPEKPPVVEAIIPETKPIVEPKKTEEEFDDPFKFDDEEDSKKDEIELKEALESDSDEFSEESETVATPGLPKKKTNSVAPGVILTIIAVFLIAVTAVWYFVFRDKTVETPEMASTPEPAVEETIIPDETAPPMMSSQDEVSSMTSQPESQVIPMIDPTVEYADNPAESMTMNEQPQIQQDTITITYSVNTGVWIYEIARQTYGNTRLWPLIFQANYTLDNNPDEILPNINLEIPRLEGTTENPTASDYDRLAQAARYVADAYEFAGNADQAAAYRKAADWYETLD